MHAYNISGYKLSYIIIIPSRQIILLAQVLLYRSYPIRHIIIIIVKPIVWFPIDALFYFCHWFVMSKTSDLDCAFSNIYYIYIQIIWLSMIQKFVSCPVQESIRFFLYLALFHVLVNTY